MTSSPQEMEINAVCKCNHVLAEAKRSCFPSRGARGRGRYTPQRHLGLDLGEALFDSASSNTSGSSERHFWSSPIGGALAGGHRIKTPHTPPSWMNHSLPGPQAVLILRGKPHAFARALPPSSSAYSYSCCPCGQIPG